MKKKKRWNQAVLSFPNLRGHIDTLLIDDDKNIKNISDVIPIH